MLPAQVLPDNPRQALLDPVLAQFFRVPPCVDKSMPRSPAISRRVLPLVSASRTASRRNSGVGLFPFLIEHRPVLKLVLSTKAGQVHLAWKVSLLILTPVTQIGYTSN